MASIRALKSGAWQVRYRDASGNERTQTCKTKAQATKQQKLVEAALTLGQAPPPVKHEYKTLDDALKRIEQLERASAGDAPGSQCPGTLGELFDGYGVLFAAHQSDFPQWPGRRRFWLDELGEHTRACEVTVAQISRVLIAERANVKAGTINKHIYKLSAVFVAAELIDEDRFKGLVNPAPAVVKRLKKLKHSGGKVLDRGDERKRRPTRDEMFQLIEAARATKGQRRRAQAAPAQPGLALIFGLEHQLSVAQLFRIRWRDIERARFRIEHPSRRRGIEPVFTEHKFTEGSYTAIVDLKAAADALADEARAFGFIDRQSMTKALNAIVRAAGVKQSYQRVIEHGLNDDERKAVHLAARRAAPIRHDAPSYYLDAAIQFAASTGVRRGELIALRWRDLYLGGTPPLAHVRHDPAAGVRTKTEKDRHVPLVPSAIDAINLMHKPLNDNARVFTVKPGTLSRAFLRLCRKLGIEDLRFHDLRHEALSHASEHYGLSDAELQMMSGHATRTQLHAYVHGERDVLYRKIANTPPPKVDDGKQ